MHKTTLIDISIQVEKVIIKIDDDIKLRQRKPPSACAEGGFLCVTFLEIY